MDPISIAALVTGAAQITIKLVEAALDGAKSVDEALDRLRLIDATLDTRLAAMKAQLAANDKLIDAEMAHPGVPPPLAK